LKRVPADLIGRVQHRQADPRLRPDAFRGLRHAPHRHQRPARQDPAEEGRHEHDQRGGEERGTVDAPFLFHEFGGRVLHAEDPARCEVRVDGDRRGAHRRLERRAIDRGARRPRRPEHPARGIDEHDAAFGEDELPADVLKGRRDADVLGDLRAEEAPDERDRRLL
jgi:hypothetical protein